MLALLFRVPQNYRHLFVFGLWQDDSHIISDDIMRAAWLDYLQVFPILYPSLSLAMLMDTGLTSNSRKPFRLFCHMAQRLQSIVSWADDVAGDASALGLGRFASDWNRI